ncbi:diguanylate cyclase [Nitrosomonas sp.]|uniref:GGDEF domain-containing protein n=1 Tax=Nitrosomonas sp. TaxID=42353 RepID=UPI001DC36FA5|nr:diguanylate cyclase [Nitrosomonas sp.]MCB1949629.1 diguanylate cyclase [Nitrosomonas sp.]
MSNNLNDIEVFPWNKNFETGLALIDEQHKILISLLNKLAVSLVRGSALEINNIFDELTKYAEFHFETEEGIWAEYFDSDSWLASHQISHSTFLPKVIELKEKNVQKQKTEIIESIILFLIRWLAFHIMDNDKRMSLVVHNINKGLSIEEARNAADKKMSGSIRVLVEAVMAMYDSLSSRTLALMKESHERQKVELELNKANKKLRKANIRLETLAITDQLTGLYNRRHFNNIFAQELRRARRGKTPFTLIILDIDFFKKINDNYGHSEGDQILIRVSQKLKEICQRPGDFVFRLGGEEFGIIATNLDCQGTMEFAEIIRKGVENLKIPNKYSKVSQYLTVSIGTFTKEPVENDTVDSFMSVADSRLYKAKRLGRNQFVSGI